MIWLFRGSAQLTAPKSWWTFCYSAANFLFYIVYFVYIDLFWGQLKKDRKGREIGGRTWNQTIAAVVRTECRKDSDSDWIFMAVVRSLHSLIMGRTIRTMGKSKKLCYENYARSYQKCQVEVQPAKGHLTKFQCVCMHLRACVDYRKSEMNSNMCTQFLLLKVITDAVQWVCLAKRTVQRNHLKAQITMTFLLVMSAFKLLNKTVC